jgi:hypothetical protein
MATVTATSSHERLGNHSDRLRLARAACHCGQEFKFAPAAAPLAGRSPGARCPPESGWRHGRLSPLGTVDTVTPAPAAALGTDSAACESLNHESTFAGLSPRSARPGPVQATAAAAAPDSGAD